MRARRNDRDDLRLSFQPAARIRVLGGARWMRRCPGGRGCGTILSVLGLGLAGYLTYEHFTSSSTLACSDNGVVQSLKVTTSSYSAVAGLPVAVLGLVFFAVMLVLQLPPMWRRPEQAIRLGRLAWAVVGLGTVLYLLYAELFAIDAICLWCTSVHVLTLSSSERPSSPRPPTQFR